MVKNKKKNEKYMGLGTSLDKYLDKCFVLHNHTVF